MTEYVFVGEDMIRPAADVVDNIMSIANGRPCIIRELLETDMCSLRTAMSGASDPNLFNQFRAVVVLD